VVGQVTADGTFSGYVPTGTYELTYTQLSEGSYPRDGVPDISGLGSVDATTNADIGTVTLATPHVVTLTATDDQGVPIADAPVRFAHYSRDIGIQASSDASFTTNAEGRLVQPTGVEGVELASEASVDVHSPQDAAYMSYWSGWLDLTSDRHLEATLSDSTAVSGTVIDSSGAAATGGSLSFYLPEQSTSWSTDVQSDGYSTKLTRDATHDVTYRQWEASKADAVARDGRPDIYGLSAVTPSGTEDTFDFTLPAAHVLDLTVETDDGTPVENADVWIRSLAASAPSRFLPLSTNAQGQLVHTDGSTIGVETAGPIEVEVQPPSGTDLQQKTVTLDVTSDTSRTVTLETPTTASTISGTIQTADGSAAVGDQVVAFTVENGEIIGVEESVPTDSSGAFSLPVTDGQTYRLGYYQFDETADSRHNAKADGSVDFYPLEVVEVTGDTAIGTTQLPVGYHLDVAVEAPDGTPVDGARVFLAATDADGNTIHSRLLTKRDGLAYDWNNPDPGNEVTGETTMQIRPAANSTAFTPKTYTETVTVTDASSLSVTIDRLPVAPSAHDYGTQPVDSTTTQTFTVTNDGDQALSTAGASITGADPASFTITDGGDAVELAPGDSHAITVAFTPVETGTTSATLRLESISDTAAERTIPLTGTGETTSSSDDGSTDAGSADSPSDGGSTDSGSDSHDPTPTPTPTDSTTDTSEATIENATTGAVATVSNSTVAALTFSNESATGTVTIAEVSPDTLTNETATLDGTVVSAVNITVPDTEENASATIRMELSQADLESLNVSLASLQVARYHDGSWQQLPTTVTVENGTVVLEAETPGFSVFAVVAAPQSTATPTPSPTRTATPTASSTPQATSTLVVTSTPSATATGEPQDVVTGTSSPTEGSGPGFTAGAVLVALIAAVLFGRRRL
jgi:PGF-pre-PGF domain-containing protein/PGF-CTERM protein